MTLIILYFWLGLSIKFDSFRGIEKEWKAILLTSILQIIVVPLIGLYFVINLTGDLREILLLLAFAPGGITSALAARLLKLDLTLSVTLTTVTTLLNLIFTQSIIAPKFIDVYSNFSVDYFEFVLSVGILLFAMLINKKFEKFASYLDKTLGLIVFGFIVFHFFSSNKEDGFALEWTTVWLLIKFHLAIIVISAIASSFFFSIKKAPVIVLEAGFQNISLVAAMAYQMGLSKVTSVPILYGGIMFLSVLLIWANKNIILKAKPRLIITKFTFPTYNAHTIPPFGILIKPNKQTNFTIRKLQLVYWNQFQKLGLLGYYLINLQKIIKIHFDKSKMNIKNIK